MKRMFGSIAMMAALGLAPGVHAATVVDWLRLSDGGSAAAFTLVNDAGLPAAIGELVIASGKGSVFLNYPMNNLLGGTYWAADPGLSDSLAGDARVNGIDFRVVPQNGFATYSIGISVPAGLELILAVGGLFRNATGSTQSIGVSAGSGNVISLLNTFEWNAGPGASYTEDLDWNPATGELTTTNGANGDSQIAFLRVAPLAGSDPRVVFSVPNGYLGATGDSITIGVGVVVPEAGVVALLGFGGLLWAGLRRR